MALYIYAFVCTAITTIWGLVHFCYWFRCRKKDTCHNRNCKWCEHCQKYDHVFTDEEKERIQKLIDSLPMEN